MELNFFNLEYTLFTYLNSTKLQNSTEAARGADEVLMLTNTH